MKDPLRAALVWIAVVVLGVPLSIPAIVWDEGWRGLFRYSLEYGFAVLAVIAVARTRFRNVVRRVIVGLYSVLLVFLIYQYAFRSFFHREAALVEDVRFAINLLHFLSEMISWRSVAIALGGLVGAVGLVLVVSRALAVLQARVQSAPPRSVAIAAVAWSIVGVSSALLHGPIRVSGASVVDNYRASVAARARLVLLTDATRDERYQDLMKVRLAKRPNFYFLVVEAYGEVLATWDMTDAYRALMTRVRGRLEAAGYHMRTAYSSAPVHGGRSWLSIATMQTGILIDEPESFTAFEATSRKTPTLVGFFRNQGYHTASVEPGTKDRAGVGRDDLYGHEVRIAAPQLGYEGKRWGFGVIPDEFTLDQVRTRHLGALAEPRYLFFMSVSTHYPWTAETVPPIEDLGPRWPPLPGVDAIGTEFRRYYLKSVEYDWRAFTEFLEAERSPEIVVLLLGDHQPRLESNAPGEVTFHTPVHVISRDAAFVEQFAKLGFQRGLFAEPGRAPPLLHEALFSLLVSELADAYGTPETKGLATYFPEGITLRGLTR